MTDELKEFQVLWKDLDPTLAQWKDEVKALRASVSSPDDNNAPSSAHERLKAARRAQDRIEEILGNLGLIRSRVRKLVSELQDTYDDAWIDVMNKTRIGEYTSAKERDATYTSGALSQLVNVRNAKRILADVEEVYDFVNLKYRGLDAVRTDAKSTLRFTEFEAHYER